LGIFWNLVFGSYTFVIKFFRMVYTHKISPDTLTLEKLATLIATPHHIELSDTSSRLIQKNRAYLERILSETDRVIYGVNTGFGKLCDISISQEKLEQLQYNLVVSHACGTGDVVPPEIVRLMLLLKIQSLSYGHSAVRLETVERLIYLYNNDILPEIFEQGSLGASGDLIPLAHMSLALIGIGNVYYKGEKMPAGDLPTEVTFPNVKLQSKEGLALLNGTQFSLAYAVWSLTKSNHLSQLADLNAAISVDAFQCRLTPFDARLHDIRPHAGQIETAASIRNWLKDSEISKLEKHSVQDPYAFRCVPQVHGASKDALTYIRKAVAIEANSVTDNPNLFEETEGVLSGGNFHAQPLALPLDMLAIALAELGSISERRLYQIISGTRGLPIFLAKNSGLNSGLMIVQYLAASIASQNKQLCTPASVDSIVSSNGQEDHVSMAANAATKAYRVVHNLERLLAIEFMVTVQALEFRRPAKSSPQIEEIVEKYRKVVTALEDDRYLQPDIQLTIRFLRGIVF